MTRGSKAAAIVLFALLASCGIDEFYYLPQISPSDAGVNISNQAIIKLPNLNITEFTYFYTFKIFYRMYVSSNSSASWWDTNEWPQINTAIVSDHGYFSSYADPTNTTISTTNMGSTFKGRGFYELEIEGDKIDEVLSHFPPSSLGKTVVLHFELGKGEDPEPTLEINGNTYKLLRTTGEGLFRPKPEDSWYFLNHTELCDSNNVGNNVNMDIAKIDDESTPLSDRVTYISLYIVATGVHLDTLTVIYSKPTFIGVLKLPETS